MPAPSELDLATFAIESNDRPMNVAPLLLLKPSPAAARAMSTASKRHRFLGHQLEARISRWNSPAQRSARVRARRRPRN